VWSSSFSLLSAAAHSTQVFKIAILGVFKIGLLGDATLREVSCMPEGGWAMELDSWRGGPAFSLLETVPKLSLRGQKTS
jgi:hypothetical protein